MSVADYYVEYAFADPGSIWEPNAGPQADAYNSEADVVGYGGAAGGGKMLVYGTQVLTPFGWRLADGVGVGDTLIAHDGTNTKVLAVYPHVDKPLYRFTFADGAEVTVSDDHVWMYWQSGKRIKAEREYVLYSPEKGVHSERVRGRLGLSEDLYALHQRQVERADSGKRPHWIITPLCRPVKFTRPINHHDKPYMIDPYLMGVLIAEGSLNRGAGLAFTSGDEEIIEWVEQALPDGDTLGFKDGFTRGISGGHTLSAIRHLGLAGTKSETKFIPQHYLFASIDDRFSLMQGLMDGDGYVDSRGHCSYTSVSPQLANDVQHLARSLGAKATITTRQGAYTSSAGERVETRLVYTVAMQGDTLARFARLPRKRDRVKPFNGGVSTAGRRIVNIEKVGSGDGVCFAIDHPSGLHVVQDFIVTHNTDILLGIGFTQARDGIIYRRHYTDLEDIVTRGDDITQGAPSYVAGSKRLWQFTDGRRLRLGAVQHKKDLVKFQGRPRDFIGIDEAAEFSGKWFRYLTGWLRTTKEGQRTRIVLTFNPPQDSEGEWIVQYFAPWLDPDHPNPAKPGELRYYIRQTDSHGQDRDVEVGKDYRGQDGHGNEIIPQSRTFIPARVKDNPHLTSDYISQLATLEEPLRSQLLYGDFSIKPKDDVWQVIPTAWIQAAQKRWREGDRPDVALRSVGSDPARGGDDKHSIARLYGTWFEIDTYPGVQTPDGATGAQQVIKIMEGEDAHVNVDVIGYGASVYDHLKARQEVSTVEAVNNAASAPKFARDKSGKYEFSNVRAWSYWKLREALDPKGGEDIALPDTRSLLVDLSAPRYSTVGGRIKIEPKDDIKARIGRSPDEGDSIVLAWLATINSIPDWDPIIG